MMAMSSDSFSKHRNLFAIFFATVFAFVQLTSLGHGAQHGFDAHTHNGEACDLAQANDRLAGVEPDLAAALSMLYTPAAQGRPRQSVIVSRSHLGGLHSRAPPTA
jgi:hypothetical protein